MQSQVPNSVDQKIAVSPMQTCTVATTSQQRFSLADAKKQSLA
jgi:hypothetical protein